MGMESQEPLNKVVGISPNPKSHVILNVYFTIWSFYIYRQIRCFLLLFIRYLKRRKFRITVTSNSHFRPTHSIVGVFLLTHIRKLYRILLRLSLQQTIAHHHLYVGSLQWRLVISDNKRQPGVTCSAKQPLSFCCFPAAVSAKCS